MREKHQDLDYRCRRKGRAACRYTTRRKEAVGAGTCSQSGQGGRPSEESELVSG